MRDHFRIFTLQFPTMLVAFLNITYLTQQFLTLILALRGNDNFQELSLGSIEYAPRVCSNDWYNAGNGMDQS